MKQLNKNRTVKMNLTTFKLASLYASVIIYLFMAFISLSSCSSDDSIPQNEQNDPEVILTSPDVILIEGHEGVTEGVIGAPGFGNMTHIIKAEAPEGFAQLVIYKVVNGVPSEYQTVDTTHPDYEAGSNEFIYELGYIFTENDLNDELYFTAEVWDVENQTTTLDFAEAIVKKPMKLVEQIFMETRMPLQPSNMQIAQFLSINGNNIGGVNLDTVLNDDLHQAIEAIISFNEVQGVYLSSTSAVGNQQSVDNIAYLSHTKFKELNAEVVTIDQYNIYDTFTIENLYENAAFGSDEEKALIEEYNVYVLKTDDGRVALFEITYFEIINNSQIYMGMDMYITQ